MRTEWEKKNQSISGVRTENVTSLGMLNHLALHIYEIQRSTQ